MIFFFHQNLPPLIEQFYKKLPVITYIIGPFTNILYKITQLFLLMSLTLLNFILFLFLFFLARMKFVFLSCPLNLKRCVLFKSGRKLSLMSLDTLFSFNSCSTAEIKSKVKKKNKKLEFLCILSTTTTTTIMLKNLQKVHTIIRTYLW